jgi:hypothetical protein
MSSGFAFNLNNPDAWRLNKELAGGAHWLIWVFIALKDLFIR